MTNSLLKEQVYKHKGNLFLQFTQMKKIKERENSLYFLSQTTHQKGLAPLSIFLPEITEIFKQIIRSLYAWNFQIKSGAYLRQRRSHLQLKQEHLYNNPA